MTQLNTPSKGKAFFDRADQVAATGNWDFAIEMYLEGILREPDNLDRGHKPLREVSLKRKVQGGKGPGMMESMKYRGGKDPLTSMRNAEFLLAKEPGSVAYMEQVLTSAGKLELPAVMKWIGDIILESQRLATKKDRRVLASLTKAYEGLEDYHAAVVACRMAVEAAPGDNALAEALRTLEAQATIKKGGYGDEKRDFTEGVKNVKAQKDLMEKDKYVQGREFLENQIDKARKEYESTPTVPGKINGYVDTLLKIEEEPFEAKAIEVLQKAFNDTSAYQFKLRIGDVKMRQMKRAYAQLMKKGDKAGAAQQAQKQLEFELAEYTERMANYPTDLAITYELARRQMIAGKLDDAIVNFQKASRDARRYVSSMTLLGQAFLRKGMLQIAAQTFERVLEAEMMELHKKELLYLLADTRQKLGDETQDKVNYKQAYDLFSQLAQIDYSYKDVRQRLEALGKLL